MRIAVVGSGRAASVLAPPLSLIPGVQLMIAARDPSNPAARKLAETCNAGPVMDVQRLWHQDLAGVVVATPASTHQQLVSAALTAKLPTFCEKPLTVSLVEGERLAERATDAGVSLVVGFHRRVDHEYAQAREVARSLKPAIIELRHFDAGWPPSGYEEAGSSIWIDQCIHDFDAFRWIAGQPVREVTAIAGSFDLGDGDTYSVETVSARLVFADGSVGELIGGRGRPEYVAGVDVRERLRPETVTRGGSPAFPNWQRRFAGAFENEMKAFVDLLRSGRQGDLASAADANAALRIAYAARESARTKRTIRLES